MNPSLTLYVTSNGVDHGPLSLEEAAKRVGSGEFKPDDLSWHQGVSGWVPLKQLPEWSQINKTPLPSLAPEKDNIEDGSALKNITNHASPANSKKINPRSSPAKSVISSSQSFEEKKGGKAGDGNSGKADGFSCYSCISIDPGCGRVSGLQKLGPIYSTNRCRKDSTGQCETERIGTGRKK